MNNFFKGTAAKVAGNVTQSVASAIIVFLITTFVLVDLKKKAEAPDVGKKDSTAIRTIISSAPKLQSRERRNADVLSSKDDGASLKNQPAKEENRNPVDRTSQDGTPQKQDGATNMVVPVQEAVSVPVKHPVEKKLEATGSEAQAKADTLKRDTTHKSEVQKVKQRSDDVFDELDEEANKKPPQ